MAQETEFGKGWTGRTLDGKYSLRERLGGSEHSAVFVTEHAGSKAAIKIIPASADAKTLKKSLAADLQLARWEQAAKLSHPNLVPMLAWGRAQIDGTPLIYVVSEFAEENLAELIPLRPLSLEEGNALLPPVINALQALHQAGWVHSRLRPSNILAVHDQLKLSTDALAKPGETRAVDSAFDAPEVGSSGISAAADVWSVGATLIAVFTQNSLQGVSAVSTETINAVPQPFREIVRQCLNNDSAKRPAVDQITSKTHTVAEKPLLPESAKKISAVREPLPETPRKPWFLIAIVIVCLIALGIFISKRSGARKEDAGNPAQPSTSPTTQAPPIQLPASSTPAPGENSKGAILNRVMPDISRSAQNTIHGTLKVNIEVWVDRNGNVVRSKMTSPGPSRYFSGKAQEVAGRWKFTPPQENGQAVESEWALRFQFKRSGTQVFPAEIKP